MFFVFVTVKVDIFFLSPFSVLSFNVHNVLSAYCFIMLISLCIVFAGDRRWRSVTGPLNRGHTMLFAAWSMAALWCCKMWLNKTVQLHVPRPAQVVRKLIQQNLHNDKSLRKQNHILMIVVKQKKKKKEKEGERRRKKKKNNNNSLY